MLTVVIPAYNVAGFVPACLRSVASQITPQHPVNIIVVIDGPTDDTEAVARRVIADIPHANVRLICQENIGLSGARNAGLALTSTEFVTFLDADDIWLPGYAANVFTAISRCSPDVVEFNAMRIDETGRELGRLRIASAQPGAIDMGSREQFLATFRCFAWARVYRTALVRRRTFPIGRRFEDTATTPWHYWNCKRIASIGKPLVGYRQRRHSILATPEAHDIMDIARTTEEAAAMYAQTASEYWQRVAFRSFQQACSRTTLLPFQAWPSCAKISSKAARQVPPPGGLARKLQADLTLLYVALLWLKRQYQYARHKPAVRGLVVD